MNIEYKPRRRTTKTRKNQPKKQYGGAPTYEDLERYDEIPADEKREVLRYVYEVIDPEDLVDHVIAWIDQNPGLRFDRYTMRELLDEYQLELQQVIADRIMERLA